MENQPLLSPIKPHFFQPILPDFSTHLNIPVSFFSRHLKGSNKQNKTAKLSSDASDKTWLVKLDGLKLTEGWEEFAYAHDLQVGDILVLRHEGEMVFHVTVLGPSCCEIHYTSSANINNNISRNISRIKKLKRKKKKNPRKKVESSFVAHVTPSSLRFDRLYFPLNFARSNGLNKMNGEEIVLVNIEGRSTTLNLKHNKTGVHTFVRPGWRRFCLENRIKKGHHCTFKLVQNSTPPILRLCRVEHRPKSESESSYFAGSVTTSSLNHDKLYLPKRFVTLNGLERGGSEIVLKNECGGRWSLVLKYYETIKQALIRNGWTSFCQANRLKAGDSFKFKLVGTGKNPVLSLCSNRGKRPLECQEGSDGDEEESISLESLDMEKTKNFSRCEASSSYSQKQFVTLTLTPYAFNKYKLHLPMSFTRANGINKPGKITLLGQDGVRRLVDLLQNKTSGTMRIGKGWRGFIEAHGVKIGESFVLELIWEDEASPVLKFCTIL